MAKIIPISEARKNLTKLSNKASKLLESFIVTVNGSPKFVLMPYDEYESWKETEDILSEPGALEDIRRAEKEIDEGKSVSWEKVKKELNLDV